MPKKLSALIACFIFLGNLAGQKEYSAEYWEKNWRDWPRPLFDYSYEGFMAVENIVLREYFSTNSNSSGEQYKHYARFQYPNQAAIDNWSVLLFQLPDYQNLEDIDFRIWEDDILLYEARASSIREKFLDTLSADPHSGKLYAFSLSFPELKPGHIVELMISLNGVPMPYHLGFHHSFPIARSVQRIKIVSAYPLQYAASAQVLSEEKRVFENKLYSFEVSNCRAMSPDLSLSTAPAELPGVYIDWLDQVFVYDREENKTWDRILENIFYQGDLQDYAVYQNSLDYEFGLQQYYGSWIRPPRYFHERPSNLNSNQANAEGRWRLSRSYAERWLKVEEDLDLIVEENGVPNFDEAMQMIYSSQKKASESYLRNMLVYPPVFTEYGLLCSHYEALLSYFQKEYRLALYYPKRAGRPDSSFPSPWPAYARGLAFRSSSEDDWTYVFPGPYFGQFFKAGEVPPDFQGGSALLFDREELKPEWASLSPVKVEEHGFSHHYKVQIRPRLNRYVLRDTMHLKGMFRSIMASAYLRGDSAVDQLSFTNFQLSQNALMNDSMLVAKSKSLKLKDTLRLSLKLDEAKSIIAAPAPDRDFTLPMAFKAEWRIRVEGRDSLQHELQMALSPEILDNPCFKVEAQWLRLDQGVYELSLSLVMKKAYIPKEEIEYYYALQSLLNSPAQILFW